VITNAGLADLLSYTIAVGYPTYGLFTNNITITATTTLADLNEAAWPGYTRNQVNEVTTPTVVSGVASSSPTGAVSFSNTGSSNYTFYGWFLYDNVNSVLVQAVNIGPTTIIAGQTLYLNALYQLQEL
jgi:hypothetical protein